MLLYVDLTIAIMLPRQPRTYQWVLVCLVSVYRTKQSLIVSVVCESVCVGVCVWGGGLNLFILCSHDVLYLNLDSRGPVTGSEAAAAKNAFGDSIPVFTPIDLQG